MRLSTIITILLTSCAIGKTEVKYREMASEPRFFWDGQELVITTENSMENSALLIYDIQSTVDNKNNLILLSGFQALGKEFKNEFRIKFTGITPEKQDSYKIYWVDPDESRTELRIEGR